MRFLKKSCNLIKGNRFSKVENDHALIVDFRMWASGLTSQAHLWLPLLGPCPSPLVTYWSKNATQGTRFDDINAKI